MIENLLDPLFPFFLAALVGGAPSLISNFLTRFIFC